MGPMVRCILVPRLRWDHALRRPQARFPRLHRQIQSREARLCLPVLTSTRFADFSSGTNISQVETKLFEDISAQMVQDLINKLLSNW